MQKASMLEAFCFLSQYNYLFNTTIVSCKRINVKMIVRCF